MSIPRLDVLVRDSRIASLQKDYGVSHGIGQDFFQVVLNECQDLIQSFLVSEQAEAFAAYKTYTISELTEYLEAPADIFSHNMIYEARYSSSSSEDDLEEPLQLSDSRGFADQGEPELYFPDDGKIYLDPRPSSGLVRIRYERRNDHLDYRRGKIDSSTGTLPEVLTIVLEDDDDLDSAAWDEGLPEYVCVVDWYGNVLMRAIPVDSYDSETRTITVHADFEAESTETIPDGAYIVFGQNASTHSDLPDCFKHFMIQFVRDSVADLLSSDDKKNTKPKEERYFQQLAAIYSQLPMGFSRIARVNPRGY